MTGLEERYATLEDVSRSMAEQQNLGPCELRLAQRKAFFDAIPKTARSFYIHLSHRIPANYPYITELQDKYGKSNILITTAPSTLEQSSAEEERKRIITPFERFSAKKSIDAIIYLCNYLCDGYENICYPADRANPINFETSQHIWRPIRLAQQQPQISFIVGYQNNFCFRYDSCNELMYIIDSRKIKRPIKITEIY